MNSVSSIHYTTHTITTHTAKKNKNKNRGIDWEQNVHNDEWNNKREGKRKCNSNREKKKKIIIIKKKNGWQVHAYVVNILSHTNSRQYTNSVAKKKLYMLGYVQIIVYVCLYEFAWVCMTMHYCMSLCARVYVFHSKSVSQEVR